MRKRKFIYLIAMLGILSCPIHSQTDSLRNDKVLSHILYYSSGLGFGTQGITFGLGGTFVSSNNWGGGISYKTNFLKSRYLPDDYFDDGMRVFTPMDYLSLITFSLIKEFPASEKSKIFGIEAGLSWVKYNVAQFELNPSYDPNSSPWFGNVYKYHKSHTASETIGLNLRGKMKFFPTHFSVFELAVFTNLNNVQSVVGIEFYINLGKIKD
jgi:hypothetical protein